MAGSVILWANNATSSLAGGITASATTAVLAAGTGALFPSPTTGQYFCLTFTDALTGLIREIVHVTNVSTDTITMVRAQEGTTAVAWLAGDLAANLITAGSLTALAQSAVIRQELSTATTFYVNFGPAAGGYGAGNDSTGNGTIATPWKTLQHAHDTIAATIDGGGQTVTISQYGDGTTPFQDTSGLVATGPVVGIAELDITLDGGINTSSTSGILAASAARLGISGTGVITATNYCIVAQEAFIKINGGITVGACAVAKIAAQQTGQILLNGSFIDGTGNAPCLFNAVSSGVVVPTGAALTITQSGAVYSTALAVAQRAGTINITSSDVTFAGTASTGPGYYADTGGGVYRNDVLTPSGVYAADAGNTGNFTCGAVTATTATVGVYHIQFIAATVFNVYYPDGDWVGQGATGVAFSGGGLGFTITAGGTPAVVGDGATITVTATHAAAIPGSAGSVDATTYGWYK